ncbi:hypothetical protein LXL04_002668 [Taraxacum kok-saghyz]
MVCPCYHGKGWTCVSGITHGHWVGINARCVMIVDVFDMYRGEILRMIYSKWRYMVEYDNSMSSEL